MYSFLYMLEVSSVIRPHLHYNKYAACPIYTITNMQRIRIYPGKLKFVLVKISPDPGLRKPNYSRFLLLRIYPDSHECKYGAYSDLSSHAVKLPG